MANVDTKEENQVEIPTSLPILPVRDIVIFPYMILPLFVGRDISIRAVDEAVSASKMILLVTQKDVNIEDPSTDELYTVGTVGTILRVLKIPDGRLKVLVQGIAKAKVLHYSQTEPFYIGNIEKVDDQKVSEVTIEDEALARNVKEQMDRSVALGKSLLPDIMVLI
ncbi:MAG TPA: endopeptidase La, partial [Nitrospirae bacterium]|nr:endopeptidase La [Nitrospirota bacterium]